MDAIQGAGIGLRNPHFKDILGCQQTSLWFEVLADNFLIDGGLNLDLLMAVAERYPTVLHGVGLSIGSVSPLDWDYLQKLRKLMDGIGAKWYSEHISFCADGEVQLPDLLPMPFNQESLAHLVDRVKAVQDYIGQPMLLENISSYIQSPHNSLFEADFIAQLLEKADCYLLLDLNNLYVCSYNHGFNPIDYLNSLPLDRIKQVHLAGHEHRSHYLLDSHGCPIAEPVWNLFTRLINMAGPIPAMVEWDNHLPDFKALLEQAQRINQILNIREP